VLRLPENPAVSASLCETRQMTQWAIKKVCEKKEKAAPLGRDSFKQGSPTADD
jgi:hypothetical protein